MYLDIIESHRTFSAKAQCHHDVERRKSSINIREHDFVDSEMLWNVTVGSRVQHIQRQVLHTTIGKLVRTPDCTKRETRLTQFVVLVSVQCATNRLYLSAWSTTQVLFPLPSNRHRWVTNTNPRVTQQKTARTHVVINEDAPSWTVGCTNTTRIPPTYRTTDHTSWASAPR